jgi:hypothetical protein
LVTHISVTVFGLAFTGKYPERPDEFDGISSEFDARKAPEFRATFVANLRFRHEGKDATGIVTAYADDYTQKN